MKSIARAAGTEGALFVKLAAIDLDHGDAVQIAEGDACVFLRAGAAVGMLGPGAYAIDPMAAPFFANVVGAPCDIVFVRTVEHGWWSMSAEPYALTDGKNGTRADVIFTGSFSVEVLDPREFATTMIPNDETWLWAYIESKVDRAVRDQAHLMMREGWGFVDLFSELGARTLAERTIKDVSGDLAGQPIRVVQFGSLLVHAA
jgi:hypothetical protein